MRLHRQLIAFALVLGALGGTSASAHAATLPAGSTSVISGTADLLGLLPTPVADSLSGHQAVSRDGTRVAFSSQSDGLVAGDDDEVENVYVKDLVTGEVQLVSRASGQNGEPSHDRCSGPAISDDGTAVAFVCRGSLDPADTNAFQDVYVRDLVGRQTTLVSHAPDGTAANSGSSEPAIDATGSSVAFTTRASNLGDGVPANVSIDRVYRGDTNGGALVLFSRNGMGGVNTQDAFTPSISDDGARVAFETGESLTATDTNVVNRDVYVGDGATSQLVSRANGAGGAVGNNPSFEGIVSGDGKSVAFASQATNLEPSPAHDNDLFVDVYVRSLQDSTTRLLSIKADGTKATGGDSVPTSTDTTASVIAFRSTATNLDPAVTDVRTEDYVSKGGRLTLVSRGDGPDGPRAETGGDSSVSGDGSVVVMTVEGAITADSEPRAHNVVLRDLSHETNRTVSRPPGGVPFANPGGDSERGSVSADGRYVAFSSDAPGLGAPAGVRRSVLVRDVVTGAVTLASREDGAHGAPLGSFASDPQISADGRRVAFTAEATGNTPEQVYVRDIPSARTFLASRPDGPEAPGDPAGDGDSSSPTISADGRRVAFLSQAKNLGDGDPDDLRDVVVRDIDAGRTILADRADGPDGNKADTEAFGAQISGDGTAVAFATLAKGLVPGDDDNVEDVFVRRIDAGSTVLASATGESEKGDSHSFAPSISRDGNRVSFLSEATNFDPLPGQKLYVRDIARHTLTVVSRADGPAGQILVDNAGAGLLSADGNHVAFVASPDTSIAPGAPADSFSRVYERDVSAGVTRLISRLTGAGGEPTGAQFSNVRAEGITADGGCVAFSGIGRLLPAPASGDHGNVYLRAVTADCGRPAGDVPATPDTAAPVLRAVSLSHSRFRAARARTPVAAAAGARRKTARRKPAPRGTVLRFTSSEAARLTILIERAQAGRRSGKGRARTCKPVRHRPKRGACTAYRRTATLTRGIQAGPGRVSLTGRIGKRRLAPGGYRLTLTARDAAGNRSRPVRRSFTVVPG